MDPTSRSKAMIPYVSSRDLTASYVIPAQLPPGACSISEIANKVLSNVLPVSTAKDYKDYMRDMTNARSQLVVDGKMFTDFYRVPLERRGQLDGDTFKKMIESAFEGRPTFFTSFSTFRFQFLSLDQTSGCKVIVSINASYKTAYDELSRLFVTPGEDGREYDILDEDKYYFHPASYYAKDVQAIMQGGASTEQNLAIQNIE